MIRLLGLADLQSGALAGLTPAYAHSDEFRSFQKPFTDWWTETIAAIGPVDIAVHNGDATEGRGRRESVGHRTTDTGRQAADAAALLAMIRARHRRMTYGTPYHTVDGRNIEDEVAAAWDAPIGDDQWIETGGIRFHFRHVAGRSDTAYGQGTQLYKEAVRQAMWADLEELPAADVVVRAHVHYYCRVETARKQAVSLPGLELPDTVFGRTCRSFYYDVGVVLFWIDPRHKEVEVRKILMPLSVARRKSYERLE